MCLILIDLSGIYKLLQFLTNESSFVILVCIVFTYIYSQSSEINMCLVPGNNRLLLAALSTILFGLIKKKK